MGLSIFDLHPPPPHGRHFFVMSSRTLLESGIFSPVEGVGIAIIPRNDGRNHCLSRSLCSIQKQGGGSESNFRAFFCNVK